MSCLCLIIAILCGEIRYCKSTQLKELKKRSSSRTYPEICKCYPRTEIRIRAAHSSSDSKCKEAVFLTLPLDVLKFILEFLDGDSLGRLSSTNRFFHLVCSQQYFWKWIMFAIEKEKSVDESNQPSIRSNAGWNTEELLEKIKTKAKLEDPCFWKTQYVLLKLSSVAFTWKPNRDSSEIQLAYQIRKKHDYSSVSITILGEGGSGKTSLIYRFVQGVFHTEYDPTIDDAFEKKLNIPNRHLSLDLSIRDTSGQEEWPRGSDIYIRESDAFLIVYSVTNQHSLHDVEHHLTRIKDLKKQPIEDIPIVLVGNKCDLYSHRQVSREEGVKVAKRFRLPLLETSAKFGINIDQVFYQLSEEEVLKGLRRKYQRQKQNCTVQ